MAVKCGNHGRKAEVYHDTVAEVRACWRGDDAAQVIAAFPGSERVETVTFSADAEERAMQEMEAEGDLEQTRRDEAAKFAHREAAEAPAVRPANPASPAQIRFVQDLARKLGSETADEIDFSVLGRADASALIDALQARVREAAAAERELGVQERRVNPDAPWLAKGTVHVIDGTYFRVHVGQNSGFPYAVAAKVLVPAVWRDGRIIETGVVEWNKVTGAVLRLTADTVATAEEASAFGKLAGRCCFCSTPIDTPESTLAGYGPVCADNRGLPWGATLSEGAATEVEGA